MNCIVRFLKNEFTGWLVWEFIYVAAATIAIGVIAMILGDTPLGIASAVAGTLYTMFAGKGKISCYIFGIFNTITYGYISYTRKIYGDMCLNWVIYLPMMFAGIILWNRRRDEQHTVIKTMLSFRSRITLILINIAAIAAFAAVLHKMGGGQPVIDSCTTVLSITAMLLTLKRCIEQWLLWTAVNLLSVIMWVRVFVSTGGGSAATLLWWLIMLLTGIIFYIQWLRPGRPR